MDYEQAYGSERKTSQTLSSFDQFTDRRQWNSPGAYPTGDTSAFNKPASEHPLRESSFHTNPSEYKTAFHGDDWVGVVDAGKPMAAARKNQFSLNEQMRKFSNRYLFETVQCNRYDLMTNYFTNEKPISEMLKTPHALTRTSKKKSPLAPNKHILVQHPLIIKRKEVNKQKVSSSHVMCTIDGTPWKPKALLERSECGWYRKHRLNTQASPVRHYKPPNLLKPSNKGGLSKIVRRDTNSFFKPVL